MQYITNLRGTRAFNLKSGTVVALAAGLLLTTAAPGTAQPLPKPKALRVVQETGTPEDVTLDFVAADINDVLKALSVQTHTNIVSGTDVKGNVTVSLAHVSLEEALDMISHLSGFQYAKLGNSYIVGSPATIATMTASTDVLAPPTTAVLTFNYTDPTSLSDTIKSRYPAVKINMGKAAGTGGRTVLLVSGVDSDITAVKQLVADTESGLSNGISGSQTVVYDIKYADPGDLELVLGRLVPNLIVTPGPTQRLAPPSPTTADASGVTATTTSYGNTGAGTGGTVTAITSNVPTKPTTTSLLLSGSDSDIARARQILATVDTRPAQINYEAKVTEVNLTNLKNFGLTYDFGGLQATIGEVLPAGAPAPTTTEITTPYPGQIAKFGTIGRSPITNLVTVRLNALINSGDARLLAAPNISAIDGQQAAVFIGDTINYISSITQSPTGQNITTSSVNGGIKLYVAGKVNNDGFITLNVHPEVSLVTLTQAGLGGAQLPDIQTREVTTTLRVHDGDTIAIAGLINQQDVKNIQKVPILGDLPFFGNLFRNVNRSTQRDEVVIFIKVSIQKDQP